MYVFTSKLTLKMQQDPPCLLTCSFPHSQVIRYCTLMRLSHTGKRSPDTNFDTKAFQTLQDADLFHLLKYTRDGSQCVCYVFWEEALCVGYKRSFKRRWVCSCCHHAEHACMFVAKLFSVLNPTLCAMPMCATLPDAEDPAPPVQFLAGRGEPQTLNPEP